MQKQCMDLEDELKVWGEEMNKLFQVKQLNVDVNYSPKDLHFMTCEHLYGLWILLQIPETACGVSTGREQLLVWTKEEAMGDVFGVLSQSLSWKADACCLIVTVAETFVHLVDGTLVLQTTTSKKKN